MLRKLMKYEFKATARTFLPLFGALIVISIVNRALDTLNLSTPRGIGIAISIIIMVAICVAALLITLQRFNKSLLQNEGYLTLTLPVKTEKLILSKLFVSSVWYIASFIVVVISIMLLTVTNIEWADIVKFFRSLFASPLLDTMQALLIVIEAIIAIILSMFASTLLLYACMSLGMLANNRRGLLAFGAFLATTTALQIIGSIFTGIFFVTDMRELFAGWSPFALAQLTLLGTAAVSLAGCVIFFWITRHMLKNRLNLQ